MVGVTQQMSRRGNGVKTERQRQQAENASPVTVWVKFCHRITRDVCLDSARPAKRLSNKSYAMPLKTGSGMIKKNVLRLQPPSARKYADKGRDKKTTGTHLRESGLLLYCRIVKNPTFGNINRANFTEIRVPLFFLGCQATFFPYLTLVEPTSNVSKHEKEIWIHFAYPQRI